MSRCVENINIPSPCLCCSALTSGSEPAAPPQLHTHTGSAECHSDGYACRSVWVSVSVFVTYPQSSFSVCDSHARMHAVSASPRPSPHTCLSHLCPGYTSGETVENYSTRSQFRLVFAWQDHFRLHLLCSLYKQCHLYSYSSVRLFLTSLSKRVGHQVVGMSSSSPASFTLRGVLM